jgi:aryl-alcohol dehydrogenase-like predicted oxidoreductase
VQLRPLGSSALYLPPVTFGAWAIGGWDWGGTDDALALRALAAAFDAGCTAVDTAPVYGFGHSEELVGRALAGRRDEVVVLTKVGLRWDVDEGDPFFVTQDARGRRLAVRRNSRPSSVRLEVERSLARLGVERIDLVQVHWPDPTTPIADTLGALVALREEGKLREIGVSNYDVGQVEEARAALGDVPLASDQVRYSLVARQPEAELLPHLARRAIGMLAYSPLEQGLLTGRVDGKRRFPRGDGRRRRQAFTPENRRRVGALVRDVVAPIAVHHGASAAQVVLAWTAARPGVTSVLAGARTPEQARENAGAAELGLSGVEHDAIDTAFARLQLAPGRPGGVRGRLAGLARRLGLR